MNDPRRKGSKRKYLYLFRGRRVSQLLFLALFLYLFIRTDYTGSDTLEYGVNLLFRIDPYLAAVTMAAERIIISLMLPSLLFILLAMILGRSFCGWICPMGMLLDCIRKILPTDRAGNRTLYPRLGRWLLVGSIVMGACGLQVGGYLDPFSLLVRAMVQAIYPSFHGITENFFTFTYTSAPDAVNTVTEPIYALMKETLLPAERKYFQYISISVFLLGLVLLLEVAQKRFFCRSLCPLGALYGLIGKYGLVRGKGGDSGCGKCRICGSLCRMGAIGDRRNLDMAACNLCMECTVNCPQQRIGFRFEVPGVHESQHDMSRRQFLGALAAGAILPSVSTGSVLAKYDNPLVIRPPGALPEENFLARCIRCGECLQVCIGNGLQPSLLQAGLAGVFSPIVVARTGYCEFNCTLCGQVCPTGALQVLTLAEKHTFTIGNAFFDKNRCLPYAKDIPCIVCEEHCPTPRKAIQFKEVKVQTSSGEGMVIKQPYVVDDLCIGCGICEYKCPLSGDSAIRITSAGEQRDPTKKIPEAPTILPGGYD